MVYRQLINSVTYQLDFTNNNFPMTENQAGSNTVKLPLEMEPDTYVLRLVSTIKVNPLRNITKEFTSKPFIIK